MALSKIDPNSFDVNSIGQYGGRRNLIINGAMQVAQRGTSITVSDDNWLYLMDRFQYDENGASGAVLDITQSTDAPDGFGYSLKVDVTTADTSLASGDGLRIQHKIEAQNLQGLAHGTSNAKSLTLSFWVKSNTTGTNVIWIYKQDSSRQTSFAYTVNSANTWEYKTISIPADTSGAIDNNTDQGMMISWYLAAGTNFNSGTLDASWASLTSANRAVGQVNNVASTSNYWAITGIQLEVGSVATPFEHRQYGEELALCQRYFEKQSFPGNTQCCVSMKWSGYGYMGHIPHLVEKRATPTITSSGVVRHMGSASFSGNITPTWQYQNKFGTGIYTTATNGPTADAVLVTSESNNFEINIDAEL